MTNKQLSDLLDEVIVDVTSCSCDECDPRRVRPLIAENIRRMFARAMDEND